MGRGDGRRDGDHAPARRSAEAEVEEKAAAVADKSAKEKEGDAAAAAEDVRRRGEERRQGRAARITQHPRRGGDADADGRRRSRRPTCASKVPHIIRGTLREYQHVALDWLVSMHEKNLNGILADEMGLGKTLMTISTLAWLACEKGVWGPHLIVVPTSVMLNWEMEIKKFAPAFKILTYFGSQKERKLKRQGWSKTNAFHVCITSYKLVIQDAAAFRRKKWKYLVLDEAHHIKNFRSQRWQTLLNFHSKRRLLLTGTPLQNNLMELWSLLHFLMPHIFESHKEFKDWFSNPMSGMVEGTENVNHELIERLHQILRPFLLRRLKKDVEKSLLPKIEHVLPCPLSKRQRELYEDYMAASATRSTLGGGSLIGIMNVLMQLRKVCNHPDLFEERPIVSPHEMRRCSCRRPASSCTRSTQGPSALRPRPPRPLQPQPRRVLRARLVRRRAHLRAAHACRVHRRRLRQARRRWTSVAGRPAPGRRRAASASPPAALGRRPHALAAALLCARAAGAAAGVAQGRAHAHGLHQHARLRAHAALLARPAPLRAVASPSREAAGIAGPT